MILRRLLYIFFLNLFIPEMVVSDGSPILAISVRMILIDLILTISIAFFIFYSLYLPLNSPMHGRNIHHGYVVDEFLMFSLIV